MNLEIFVILPNPLLQITMQVLEKYGANLKFSIAICGISANEGEPDTALRIIGIYQLIANSERRSFHERVTKNRYATA